MDFSFESVFSSFISLTIGTLIGSEVTRYFYKPRVIVKYKNLAPLDDINGVYWSLQIENYGRTVAKQCVAVVTLYDVSATDLVNTEDVDALENLPQYRNENIDIETPRKQIVSKDHFRPLTRVSLCWAKLGNPDMIDINPGISQVVDLCKFHKNGDKSYFIFPSEDGWRRIRVRIIPRQIRGHILICPSNEFPTRVNFEIMVSDNGESQMTAKKPGMLYKIRKNKFD